MPDAATQPLSDAVQTGIRLPVILIALAGVVLALVMMRRLGVVAGILGALGSLFVAIDQTVNIAWVLHVSSLAERSDVNPDDVTSLSNVYTILDAVLITIAAALLVATFLTRRSGQPATAVTVPAQAAYPAGPFGAAPAASQPPHQGA